MNNTLSKKITTTKNGIVIAAIIILIRLVYLQVHLQTSYAKRSTKNFLRIEKIPARRGNILDCHGQLLATNKPIRHLYWQGTGKPNLSDEQRKLLLSLENIIQVDSQTVMIKIKRAERRRQQVLLCENIELKDLTAVLEQYGHHPNLSVKHDFKRHYPHHAMASHILGYLGDLSIKATGKMGLEKTFEETLQGTYGTLTKKMNAYGAYYYQEATQQALAGADVKTTIDLSLQRLAEQSFAIKNRGAIIVMDPQTGAIKALVSRPTFDPNIFLKPISFKTWQHIQNEQPFLNRAFAAAYPPASIFKLVTLSAALEEGIIQPDAWWHCKGYIKFYKHKYYCNAMAGHGLLSTQEAVAQSCNILFYKIGKRISIDVLADYAHRFGLGQKTNERLPEKTGLVPSLDWKEKVKGEPWWPGETLSATIGQSYLLATPIQIARMIGSIFQGYLVKPRLIQNESIETEELKISPKTRSFLQKAMASVVAHGTGKMLRNIKDITLFAKTGTAQTAKRGKKWLDPKFKEHAWCTGYFQYKQENPLVLVILVEKAGSSRIAIQMAHKFLSSYTDYMKENR